MKKKLQLKNLMKTALVASLLCWGTYAQAQTYQGANSATTNNSGWIDNFNNAYDDASINTQGDLTTAATLESRTGFLLLSQRDAAITLEFPAEVPAGAVTYVKVGSLPTDVLGALISGLNLSVVLDLLLSHQNIEIETLNSSNSVLLSTTTDESLVTQTGTGDVSLVLDEDGDPYFAIANTGAFRKIRITNDAVPAVTNLLSNTDYDLEDMVPIMILQEILVLNVVMLLLHFLVKMVFLST